MINIEEEKVYCGFCQVWHDKNEIQRRRLNTAYLDDSLNYLDSCKEAYDEAYNTYKSLWEEYYSSII